MRDSTNVGRRRRRAMHRTSVLALVLAMISAIASAATQGHLAVSAQVLPRTMLQVRSAPVDLAISAHDLRRGYVDVRKPTRVEVSNNDPRGYVLFVSANIPGVTALVVRVGGLQVTLRGEGGVIPEPGRVGVHMPLCLRYRFKLDSRIEPGRYPWVVHLGVRPLVP